MSLNHQLLADFLTTNLSFFELAERHHLSLPELLAWADSPEITRLLDDLDRLAARRARAIAAESAPRLLTALTSVANESAHDIPPTDPSPDAKPSRHDTHRRLARESARKACAAILRLAPKAHARKCRIPEGVRDKEVERHAPSRESKGPQEALSRKSPSQPAAPSSSPAMEEAIRGTPNVLPAPSLRFDPCDLGFTRLPGRLADVAGRVPP